MDKDKLISVTAVIDNCEKVIEAYVKDVLKVLAGAYEHYELVLIDNGSIDGSVEVVNELLKKHKQIRLIVLSRRYDWQIALTAALENCIGDYVVNMDINTDPPELIPEMIDKTAAGFEVVTATALNSVKDPFWYQVSQRIFFWLSNMFTNYKMDFNWSNFFCFSRKMVNSIIQIKDRVRYLKHLKMEVGFKHGTLEYEQINRSGKKSKKSFLDPFLIALDMLCSSSEKLMRLAPVVALVASALNILFIVYAFAIKIFKEDVAAGWASTSIVLASMFGLIFFLLFVISEYLLLVYKETKKGPLYYIADESSSSVLFDDFKDKIVV